MATDPLPALCRQRAGAGYGAAGLLVVAVPALVLLGGDYLEALAAVSDWPRTEAVVTAVRLDREEVGAATRTDTARISLVLDYAFEVDGRRYEVTGDRSPAPWAESHDPALEAAGIRDAGRVEVAYDPEEPSSATAFPEAGCPSLGLLLACLVALAGFGSFAAFLFFQVRVARLRRTCREP